jgi:hypothetical protein
VLIDRNEPPGDGYEAIANGAARDGTFIEPLVTGRIHDALDVRGGCAALFKLRLPGERVAERLSCCARGAQSECGGGEDQALSHRASVT